MPKCSHQRNEKAKFFVDTSSVQCYTNHVTRSLPFLRSRLRVYFFACFSSQAPRS
uniref:Uncharacterized protein n=2 Tax=unclassified Caudoviricetes TaxID=2788787 RepID=A0A8S5Q8N8_9CAUD|nr:MAG TPA: hypothetical protein [Siphoviridae sp. ctAvK3]DAE15163.1 MAG TPA: hypothetical protein [Siphoviridae sp. ctdVv30]